MTLPVLVLRFTLPKTISPPEVLAPVRRYEEVQFVQDVGLEPLNSRLKLVPAASVILPPGPVSLDASMSELTGAEPAVMLPLANATRSPPEELKFPAVNMPLRSRLPPE